MYTMKGNMSLYSDGVVKHYQLTLEQQNDYEKLHYKIRRNYMLSFTSSFLGITLCAICFGLMIFEPTRIVAIYTFCGIIVSWISFVSYLTYQIKQIEQERNNLIGRFEIIE